MRARLTAYLLMIVLALLVASCGQSSDPIVNTTPNNEITNYGRNLEWTFGDPLVLNLVAGKTMIAGTLTVSNDADYLYFTYGTTGDWLLLDTHLHVADSFNGIPHNRSGNPQPGQFTYKNSFNPGVTTKTYAVPRAGFTAETLYFAAHSVVQSATYGTQTGWAGCLDFPGKNWATYCTYTPGDCEIELPEYDVDACGIDTYYHYMGTTSYWDLTFTGIPSGYDVYDGTWPGWCAQQFVYINNNAHYPVCLISAYDDPLPSPYVGVDWEKVTYLINHKDPAATITDIQQAIWHYTLSAFNPTDPEALAMIADAEANGTGYMPGEGELMAVLVYVSANLQSTFVEIPIDCIPE